MIIVKKEKITKLTLSALFVALGIILPFFTGQIKEIGNMLLPMHIPVILCGLICGPWYGLGIGFVVPLMRSIMFGMPMIYPSAIAMAFELATYGFVVGFFYSKSPWKCIKALYKAMLTSMVAGRLVWGIAMTALMGIKGSAFGLGAFFTGAVINAVPGIILQLILVPSIMVALKRAKLVPLINHREKKQCTTK